MNATRRRKAAPVPTEAEVLKACLAILRAHGVMCWRNNVGAMAGEHNGKRRFVRFGMPGASDILGVTDDGKFLAVEVKRPGGKPTEAQEAFLDAVRLRGGVALLIDDTAKLMEWLEKEGLTDA